MNKTRRPFRRQFRQEQDTYRITWDDPNHRLHNLEIDAKHINIGDYEKLMLLWAKVTERGDDLSERVDSLSALREKLGSKLIAWTYEDENGNPVPANAAGLAGLSRDEFFLVLGAYAEAASGVSDPLGEDSDSGVMSLAELPMTEPSSPSRLS